MQVTRRHCTYKQLTSYGVRRKPQVVEHLADKLLDGVLRIGSSGQDMDAGLCSLGESGLLDTGLPHDVDRTLAHAGAWVTHCCGQYIKVGERQVLPAADVLAQQVNRCLPD